MYTLLNECTLCDGSIWLLQALSFLEDIDSYVSNLQFTFKTKGSEHMFWQIEIFAVSWGHDVNKIPENDQPGQSKAYVHVPTDGLRFAMPMQNPWALGSNLSTPQLCWTLHTPETIQSYQHSWHLRCGFWMRLSKHPALQETECWICEPWENQGHACPKCRLRSHHDIECLSETEITRKIQT